MAQGDWKRSCRGCGAIIGIVVESVVPGKVRWGRMAAPRPQVPSVWDRAVTRLIDLQLGEESWRP